MRDRTGTGSAALACEACGRLPHPPPLRLALAKLAAIFPIELAAHAFLVHFHLSYVLTVALPAVTATGLVIWVVEPSAMRLLGTWLHARAVRDHHRLHTAPALWRIRTVVPDEPGALERLAGALANLDVNILSLEVQPGLERPLDELVVAELVVAAPHERSRGDLLAAVAAAGGTQAGVWPTSVMALAEGATRALDQAVRVATEPDDLPEAVAELVRARRVDDPRVDGRAVDGRAGDGRAGDGRRGTAGGGRPTRCSSSRGAGAAHSCSSGPASRSRSGSAPACSGWRSSPRWSRWIGSPSRGRGQHVDATTPSDTRSPAHRPGGRCAGLR